MKTALFELLRYVAIAIGTVLGIILTTRLLVLYGVVFVSLPLWVELSLTACLFAIGYVFLFKSKQIDTWLQKKNDRYARLSTDEELGKRMKYGAILGLNLSLGIFLSGAFQLFI